MPALMAYMERLYQGEQTLNLSLAGLGLMEAPHVREMLTLNSTMFEIAFWLVWNGNAALAFRFLWKWIAASTRSKNGKLECSSCGSWTSDTITSHG